MPKVIVVGGGLAGLAATIKISAGGVPVDLFEPEDVVAELGPQAIGDVSWWQRAAVG